MAKKLLSERQIRRFAKLANLRPINEMTSMYEEEEEGMEGEPMADIDADADMEADAELAPAIDDEAGMEPEGDMGEADLELSSADISAIAGALPALEKLAAAAPEAAGEGDLEVDDEMIDDEMPDAGMGDELVDDEMPDAGMDDEAELEELEEALRGINYIPGKKEVVNEVARRVAKRLLKAKKAEAQLQEALGNRRAARRTTRRRKK